MFKSVYSTKLGTLVLALTLAGGLGGMLIGCGDDAQTKDSEKAGPGEVRSAKQRIANPQVSGAHKEELVAGNTEFALDLYTLISGDEGNLFYSPSSISEALVMTYAGARGETAEQMAQTLNLTLDNADLHPAFNWLDAHLMDLGEPPQNEKSEEFQLSVVNSIWGQSDYHFEADFLDTLALNYGAGLNTLDFVTEPDASRKTINDWVEEKTQERIKDLIPEDSISMDTRLVLTNAIFFKASWLNAFDKEATTRGDFTRPDGSTVSADLMHQIAGFKYAELAGLKAIELPYDGGNVSMLVLLPDDLHALEQDLSASLIDDTVGALEFRSVDLTLPKFEFTLAMPLAQRLVEMGMEAAFNPEKADFSGMNGQTNLYISDVVHKAFVAVDEEGTEAAAATAVVIDTESAMPDEAEFKADKPFIFMIRANETGSILFMGRVVDPTA